MSLRPRFIVRIAMSTLTVLVLAVIAGAWHRWSTTVPATTRSVSVVQVGPSCPLTPAQQLKSVKTFAKMMPVFRHPRCINCHGAIEVFPQPVTVNGKFVRKGDPVRHAGVVDIDSTDSNRTCEECHMDGWVTAPFNWTDKSDMDLCRGMHGEFAENAPGFIDHIRRDGGRTQFIEAAFKGLRGLTEGGQTIYQNETGRKLLAERPPGTHAQLLQQAQDWVAAQGGKFVGDPDCGCVVDKLEIQVRSTMTITSKDGTSTITGQGGVVVKLGPERSAPEWDVATGMEGDEGDFTWSGVTVKPSTGCQIDILASPATKTHFWLGMSYTPDLKLSLGVVPGPDVHSIRQRCRNPVTGALTGSKMADDKTGPIFAKAWSALHGAAPGSGAEMGAAAPDLSKIMSMDPKALDAMAEAMKNNPSPADAGAQMKALMNQMVPGASEMAAAARNNFRFAIPDNKSCKLTPGTEFVARCDFDRTVKVSDPRAALMPGGAPSQTITEKTTITFGKQSATQQ